MPDLADFLAQEPLAALHQRFVANAGPDAVAQPYSAGIVLPSGEIVAQLSSAPLFADILAGSARHASERYPGSTWQAGHVLVSNSPFLGGLALDTVIVLVPVMARSPAAGLAAHVGLAVQYRDIGAMAETAYTLRRETRHEGFCLSLLRIAAPDDRLPETLLAMLRANVRHPDEAARWLTAQVAAARSVAAGVAVLDNLSPALTGQASPAAGSPEERQGGVPDAADLLRRMPQGRFSGSARLSSPGDAGSGAQVRAELAISEAAIHATLSVIDADKVAPDCNAPLSATRAAVLTALAEATGASPWLLARTLRLDTGGSGIVNAAYPAAVGRGAITAFACYRAVLDALPAADAAAGAGYSFDAFTGRK